MRNRITPRMVAKMVALACMFVMVGTSCKKESKDEGGGAGKKVTDLVPEKFLAVARNNGMTVYEGTTPPKVEGKFEVGKIRFDFSNWQQPNVYPQPGTVQNINFTLVLSNQKDNQDISITMDGYYMGVGPATNQFITGSGNNFTLCFKSTKVGGVSALFAYPYATVISGTVDGTTLKNVKLASIGLEYTNSQGFTVTGNVDISSDADGVSQKLP